MGSPKLKSTYTPANRPNFNDWAKYIANTIREQKGVKKIAFIAFCLFCGEMYGQKAIVDICAWEYTQVYHVERKKVIVHLHELDRCIFVAKRPATLVLATEMRRDTVYIKPPVRGVSRGVVLTGVR